MQCQVQGVCFDYLLFFSDWYPLGSDLSTSGTVRLPYKCDLQIKAEKAKEGVSFKDSQNSINAIVFKLQVILLMMEVSEKSKSSYYSLSYWDRHPS